MTKICYNGEIVDYDAIPMCLTIDQLLGYQIIYQNIHAIDHRPLHLKQHIDIAIADFNTVNQTQHSVSQFADLSKYITRLLIENNAPKDSIIVRLYLIPDYSKGWDKEPSLNYMLSYCGQLLYRGYTIWHTRMKATAIPFDNCPDKYNSVEDLNTSAHIHSLARRAGYDIALRENHAGQIVGTAGALWCSGVNGAPYTSGLGETPIFFIKKGIAYTPPLNYGVLNGVQRRMTIDTITSLGIVLQEESEAFGYTLQDAISCDEIFTVTSQGMVSMLSLENKLLYNFVSTRISEKLQKTIDNLRNGLS